MMKHELPKKSLVDFASLSNTVWPWKVQSCKCTLLLTARAAIYLSRTFSLQLQLPCKWTADGAAKSKFGPEQLQFSESNCIIKSKLHRYRVTHNYCGVHKVVSSSNKSCAYAVFPCISCQQNRKRFQVSHSLIFTLSSNKCQVNRILSYSVAILKDDITLFIELCRTFQYFSPFLCIQEGSVTEAK